MPQQVYEVMNADGDYEVVKVVEMVQVHEVLPTEIGEAFLSNPKLCETCQRPPNSNCDICNGHWR